MLLVDAGLNKIQVEYNHWFVVLIFGICYNLILITATFGYQLIVYPFAIFDSLISWALTCGLVPLGVLSHLLVYVIAKQRTFSSKSPFSITRID